jgi:transcriptional regulator with XRE-family HTH domain
VLTKVPTRSVRGLDLRLWRTRSGITQTALAVEMKVSRPRVSQIEATYRPSRTTIERYQSALKALVGGAQ